MVLLRTNATVYIIFVRTMGINAFVDTRWWCSQVTAANHLVASCLFYIRCHTCAAGYLVPFVRCYPYMWPFVAMCVCVFVCSGYIHTWGIYRETNKRCLALTVWASFSLAICLYTCMAMDGDVQHLPRHKHAELEIDKHTRLNAAHGHFSFQLARFHRLGLLSCRVVTTTRKGMDTVSNLT